MAAKTKVEALFKKAEEKEKEGKADEAFELYAKVLEKNPDHAPSLHALGTLFALKNELEKAEKLIRKSLSLNQKDAMALHSLASILRLTGRKQEAFDILRAAQNLAPDNPQILLSMGEMLNAFGKFGDATTVMIAADRLAPKNPAVLVQLSKALAGANRMEEALKVAQASINLAPEAIGALENASEICFRAGNIVPVIECYERLIALKPNEKKYYQDLSLLYEKTHQFEKAYSTFKKLMENNIATSGDYAKLGEYAYYAQETDEGIKHLNYSLSLDPNNNNSLTFLGRCYAALGEKDTAKDYFQKAIAANPEFINAYFFLSELAPFKKDDPAFEVLENLKKGDKLQVGDKSALGFALGRMYQGIKNYDKAFENFQEGNKFSAKYFGAVGYAFDREDLENNYAIVQELFSRENRKKLKFKGSKSTKPVFILGMPRSGTTLLEQMLASHSEISSAGELSDLTANHLEILKSTRTLEGAGRVGAVLSLLDAEGKDLVASYLKTLKEKAGKTPLVIDKMPQNFVQLGLISVLFPKAKVIYMKRDPMDVGLSIFTNQFYGDWTFSHDLDDIGFYYRKYQELMAGWKKTLDIPIHTVEYENLVANPEKVVRDTIKFCDLEWQPACLEFFNNKGKVFTTSVMQVRNPVNKKAVGKWKPYKKHLGPLRKALLEKSSKQIPS